MKRFFLWIVLPGIVLGMVYQSGFKAGLSAGNSGTTIVPAADLPQDNPVKIAKPKTHPKLISTDNVPASSPAVAPPVAAPPAVAPLPEPSLPRSTNPSDFYAPPPDRRRQRSVYDRSPPGSAEEFAPLVPLNR